MRAQLAKQPASKLFYREFLCPSSTVDEVVRVRFCCLLNCKTNTGNTGRTVLGHRPKGGPSSKKGILGTRKAWEWQCSSERLREQFRIIFEGTAHENMGLERQKVQKVHPNFAPNITMEFHYHAFCAHAFCAPENSHFRKF